MEWWDLPNAPENGEYLGKLSELSEGGIHEVIFGEGKEAFRIIMMKQDNGVKAYLNRCPHFGVAMNTQQNTFLLLPEHRLMCAIHCAVFQMSDGLCVDGPVKGDHLNAIDTIVDTKGNIVVTA